MQGKIYNLKILRGNKIIEYPEYDGISNMRRSLTLSYSDSIHAVTQCGFWAASASASTSQYRRLSGSWEYVHSAQRFNRLTGSETFVSNDRRGTILTEHGITCYADSASSTFLYGCTCYQLSVSAAPVLYTSNFISNSALYINDPTLLEVTNSAGLRSVSTALYLSAHLYTITNNFTTSPCIRDMDLGGVTFGNNASTNNMSIRHANVQLPTPISVQAGDQISLTYELSAVYNSDFMPAYGSDHVLSDYVEGWPFRYTTTNIVGNGTHVTITVPSTPKQHFLVGDLITVEAVPLRKNVTNVTSSPSTWTVVANNHGYSVSNSVVHENISNAAYNGTYTIATVPDVNTYTITNASNPGTSPGGTTRLNTPGSYYNGEYVVTAVTPTTVTYANTTTSPPVDLSTVVLTSPDRYKMYILLPGTIDSALSITGMGVILESDAAAYPILSSPSAPRGTAYWLSCLRMSATGSTEITLGVNDTPRWSQSTVDSWARIKRICGAQHRAGYSISTALYGAGVIYELVTPQPKHQGYALKLYAPYVPMVSFSPQLTWDDAIADLL